MVRGARPDISDRAGTNASGGAAAERHWCGATQADVEPAVKRSARVVDPPSSTILRRDLEGWPSG